MSTERRKCLVTLGLSEGATEDDIKKAYRKMALLYHPDKNGSEDAKGKFQEIGYAYKYLTEGPSAFETTNPHDVREELLRRMFEEMFFAQFHGPFAFFCEDSDEDDYYIYHDSSDDDYNASYGTHDAYGHTRTFQNTYASQTPLHQNYPQVSKKQIRKREKRQRQKERAKERKEQGRQEKREAKNVYTDDINSEQKQREQKTESAARDNHDKQSAGKTDSGNSRPDTPVMDQQPQKSNKKQKKKIESEQRKREKEMEEIAAELKKKHEREMEKQKEKERLAAQKREEGKENEINFSHFFDTGKKTRKARQREKKRQESGIGATQRDNSGSSVQSERTDKPLHRVNTNTNSTSSKKAKEKTGVSINKTQERNRMPTKPAKPGNRFVILDEIDNDIIRPLSRTSISSNDSGNNSQKNEDGRYSGRSQTNGTFKSFSFRNTNMNQNNSNSNLCTDFSNTETIRERDTKGNEGFARPGNRINQNGKNMQDNFKGRSVRQPFSRSSSYDPSGFNAFEGEKERQFVEDWSVGVDDYEDNISDNWSNYGPTQFTNDQTGAPYGYGSKPVPDKFGNGYNGWNEARGGSHQPRGYQKKKEFVPRTRGNHGMPDSGSYFHGPQNGVPPYGRGYAPFTRGGEGMFHHQPPHFRGGYHGMPPFRGRNGGYSGPRYGPPVGMPGNYYRHPFDSPMHNGFFYGREGNFNSDMNRNTNWRGNNRKQFNPNKSFNSNFTQKLDSTKKECNQNDLPSNTVKSNNTPSASGSRESSPQFMSWQNIKDSDKNGQFNENMFSNLGNNQASSSGSLDSLDDIVNYEANRVSDNQNVMNGTSAASASRSFLDSGVDMGMSEFLSKDSLGVPSGMFTDNIKNYYR